MKVLVLGANGQLGHELMKATYPPGWDVRGTLRAEVNFVEPTTIAAAVERHRPDIVINAVAYTAVDRAESDQATTFAVNAGGVEALARATAAGEIPVIHVSSDYVFDGQGKVPYVETDSIAPLGVYGASKAAGEAALRLHNRQHVIIRTSWVYAVHGHNFVNTMLRLGRERTEVGVVSDQYGAPTAAGDIAKALIKIAECVGSRSECAVETWGTYHFCGAGETSWHGFAEYIFADLHRRIGRRPVCRAILTSDYPTPARRPTNSRLNCSRFVRVFALQPTPWQQSLDRVLDEIAAAGAG